MIYTVEHLGEHVATFRQEHTHNNKSPQHPITKQVDSIMLLCGRLVMVLGFVLEFETTDASGSLWSRHSHKHGKAYLLTDTFSAAYTT